MTAFPTPIAARGAPFPPSRTARARVIPTAQDRSELSQ